MLELEQLSNYNAQLHQSCDFVMKRLMHRLPQDFLQSAMHASTHMILVNDLHVSGKAKRVARRAPAGCCGFSMMSGDGSASEEKRLSNLWPSSGRKRVALALTLSRLRE